MCRACRDEASDRPHNAACAFAVATFDGLREFAHLDDAALAALAATAAERAAAIFRGDAARKAARAAARREVQ